MEGPQHSASFSLVSRENSVGTAISRLSRHAVDRCATEALEKSRRKEKEEGKSAIRKDEDQQEEMDGEIISHERQTLLVEMEALKAFNGLEGEGKLCQIDGEWQELPKVRPSKDMMKYNDKLLLPSPEPKARPNWRPAAKPESEEYRIRLICLLNLLETTPLENDVLQNILKLAKRMCRTSYAALTLVTEEHCVLKSQIGLRSSFDRSISMCSHAIQSPTQAYVIENLEKDARFSDNPLVTDGLKLRFYAGIPLFVQGVGLGTLCVMDDRPMKISAESLLSLKQLKDTCIPLITRNALFDEICYLSDENSKKDSQIDYLQRKLAANQFRNEEHKIRGKDQWPDERGGRRKQFFKRCNNT
eukprot:jgi/Bigna1/140538/aug1.56_g15246